VTFGGGGGTKVFFGPHPAKVASGINANAAPATVPILSQFALRISLFRPSSNSVQPSCRKAFLRGFKARRLLRRPQPRFWKAGISTVSFSG
jgi:hypothetical protein